MKEKDMRGFVESGRLERLMCLHQLASPYPLPHVAGGQTLSPPVMDKTHPMNPGIPANSPNVSRRLGLSSAVAEALVIQ